MACGHRLGLFDVCTDVDADDDVCLFDVIRRVEPEPIEGQPCFADVVDPVEVDVGDSGELDGRREAGLADLDDLGAGARGAWGTDESGLDGGAEGLAGMLAERALSDHRFFLVSVVLLSLRTADSAYIAQEFLVFVNFFVL